MIYRKESTSVTVLTKLIAVILFAEKLWGAFALQKLLTFFSAKNVKSLFKQYIWKFYVSLRYIYKSVGRKQEITDSLSRKAKYAVQSLQKAKVGGLVYTLWSIRHLQWEYITVFLRL